MKYLYEKILDAQQGNEDEMLTLIDQFRPLISKQSKILREEDSFEDVQTKFIEIINTMKLEQFQDINDPFILKYLKTCIKNYCVKTSQKRNSIKVIPLSLLTNYIDDENDIVNHSTPYWFEKALSCKDEYPLIELDMLQNILTTYECNVIYYFYYQRYKVKEIACYYHVSLSAISQVKTNALKKLKKQLKRETFYNYAS